MLLVLIYDLIRSAVSDLEKKVCRLETLNSAANIKINTLNTQLQVIFHMLFLNIDMFEDAFFNLNLKFFK